MSRKKRAKKVESKSNAQSTAAEMKELRKIYKEASK